MSNDTNTSPATKLVTIELVAVTRVQYSEVIEVPADATHDQLDALVYSRYGDVDGGEYQDDPEYWEKGNCSFSNDDNAGFGASKRATVDASGKWIVASINGH